MKNGAYETRREQIEKGFYRAIAEARERRNFPSIAKEELHASALVGAYEERIRILTIIVDTPMPDGLRQQLCEAVRAQSIDEVLGYE